MSDDLIRREDAIKAIEEHCFFINNQCTYPSEGCIEVIEDAINVPSADRPQGEWIEQEDCWQCSECGDEYVLEVDVKPIDAKMYYCPNCGARMKGADDNRDYERAAEQREYDMLYESTYNPEDGSM